MNIYDIKISRNTDPLGRPPKAAPVFLFILYHKYLLIFLIYSLYIPYIYIYVLNMFHIFSLVCFLIYGVKSRSGHDRSQSFWQILHMSGPKLTFGGNFQMILYGFAWRSSKNTFWKPSNFRRYQKHIKTNKTEKYTKSMRINKIYRWSDYLSHTLA